MRILLEIPDSDIPKKQEIITVPIHFIDGKEPQYELRQTDEEIKLGDEVIGDYGAKGVVVGIETYNGNVFLSLLMKNHKVPQIVRASEYKTKTGRHFPQIAEVLEQIRNEDKEVKENAGISM